MLVFIAAVLVLFTVQPGYSQLHRFGETAITSDGGRVAYVAHRSASDVGPKELILINSQDSQQKALSIRVEGGLKAGSQHDIAWSPDGSHLVFFGTDTSGQSAVYIADVSANSVRRTCFLNGEAACLRWSPDGKTVGMLYTEGIVGAIGPLSAAPRDTGLIADHGDPQRIALLDPYTSDLRQVSPPSLHVYEFCWSPDGRSFAAIAAPPPGNNNWYTADLYRIDASSGAVAKLLAPGMQISVPRWSPDGSQIAFIGGLMSDESIPSGDIYVIPAAGGHPRNLTSGIHMSPCWLRWTNDSRGLQIVAVDSGAVTIAAVDVASSTVTRIWHGSESLGAEYGNAMPNISLSNDGKTSAVVRESFENPPELWTGPIGKWQQVTRLNSNVSRTWGHSMSVTWRSDSMTIQGWMIIPPNFDSTNVHPMVVDVHGGPADAYWPWWPSARSLLRVLTGAGYCVFLPNIRGSSGCGESFVRGNVKDFGYGDFRDILTGVDAMQKQFSIDPNRLGIIGWSYGGYMAMWAVTQTDRFRAAVAGAGIANWLSYYAQNGINRWATSYFGGIVYDDPETYARSSPINFIKQAKTPTLIVVGESDRECPAAQAYEFWTGLRHMGVKTQLYVYPSSGHALSSQQSQDFSQRSLRWFNENMR